MVYIYKIYQNKNLSLIKNYRTSQFMSQNRSDIKQLIFSTEHRIQIIQQSFTVNNINDQYVITHQLKGVPKYVSNQEQMKDEGKQFQEIKQKVFKVNQSDDFSLISYMLVFAVLVVLIVFFMAKKLKSSNKKAQSKHNFQLIQFQQEQNPEFPYFQDNQ